MSASRFIGRWSETLRMMPDDQRLETIVEMHKVANAEWAAMILEHTTRPDDAPPIPAGDADIRELLQDLGLPDRCAVIGELFGAICDEFARLIADRPRH